MSPPKVPVAQQEDTGMKPPATIPMIDIKRTELPDDLIAAELLADISEEVVKNLPHVPSKAVRN